MLIRNENEIEIWTEEHTERKSKYFFIASPIIAIVLCILFLEPVFGLDYSEKYFALFIFIILPTLLFVITGFLNLIQEKTKPHLILKINNEYIEIYEKNEIKKILLKQINKVIMQYYTFKKGDTIAFFYNEDNVEKVYFLRVSIANRGLVRIALKNYKADLFIDENRYHPLIKNKN